MNEYAHDPLASLSLDMNPVGTELPTNLNICNPLAGAKSSKGVRIRNPLNWRYNSASDYKDPEKQRSDRA